MEAGFSRALRGSGQSRTLVAERYGVVATPTGQLTPVPPKPQ
jgi:hypothetical protein